MGDGVIDIPRVRSAVEALGYDGYVEVELFSNAWWSRSMDEVIQTCIERVKTVV
jgi:sugar phosphate isomerase/epimerase